MTFKEIIDTFLEEKHRSAPPTETRLMSHGVRWVRGDKFNYRVYAGLLLIDREAAKLYFQTTS